MGFFPEQKPTKFGRYILLDRINVGGMAEVFRGKMQGVEGFERLVALKRILPGIASDPDFIEMFVDEAKLAVQLQHANIAQIFDLGKVDDNYYIAMEYVSGIDLRTMWDRARNRNRLLPIAMSCYIMQRACEGLDAAHRKKDQDQRDIGLVHRDVSPQNVLISYEGEVKVIDFGIAKSKSKVSKTQAGILKGKFGYMSPEQVRGVDLDNRSDIFACGAVLYELVVGDRLFLGESDFSTLEKVRNVEMVPPTRLNKNLSPHLERIVMKALAKNREDRYRWASEMAEDLQRYLFSSNQPFARTDMQRYLAQHFKEEMDKEQERLDRYKTVTFSMFDDESEREDRRGGMSSRSRDPSRSGQTEVGGLAEMRRQLQEERDVPLERVPTALKAKPMAIDVPPADRTNRTPPPVLHPREPMQIGVSVTPRDERPARMPAWVAGLIGGLIAIIMVAAGVVYYQAKSKDIPGSIMFDVEPKNADIYLNDKLVSNSAPFTMDNLAPNTYVLTVKKDGFDTLIRPVAVTSGEMRHEVVQLDKKKGSASLLIKSNPPGLAVFLDGADTGKVTPVSLTALDEGEHQVMFKRADGVIVTRSRVELKTGTVESIELETSKLPALLNATSVPEGARVLVNDVEKGTTPLTVVLRPGQTKIVFAKDGCTSHEMKVNVERATELPLNATLQCGTN